MPQFVLLFEKPVPTFAEQFKLPWSKVLCDHVRAAPQSKKDPGTGGEETFFVTWNNSTWDYCQPFHFITCWRGEKERMREWERDAAACFSKCHWTYAFCHCSILTKTLKYELGHCFPGQQLAGTQSAKGKVYLGNKMVWILKKTCI